MDWTRTKQRPAYSGASKYRYDASLNGLNARVEQTCDGWSASNWEDSTGDTFTSPENHQTLRSAKASAEAILRDY